MPSPSTLKVHSISTWPAGFGVKFFISIWPTKKLSLDLVPSPSRTRTVMKDQLSSTVLNFTDSLTGIVEFLLIIGYISKETFGLQKSLRNQLISSSTLISVPSVRGVTSLIKNCWTPLIKLAACLVAPKATTQSGSISDSPRMMVGAPSKKSASLTESLGMRDEPPTRTNSWMSVFSNYASSKASTIQSIVLCR